MPNRRLTLRRETLTALDNDQLTSVAAGAISTPHVLCLVTSVPQSACPDTTCGFGCTYNTNCAGCTSS